MDDIPPFRSTLLAAGRHACGRARPPARAPAQPARLRGPRVLPRAVRGFTLVELVLVMVLVGILAVVALARKPSDGTFRIAAAGDELAVVLRHAQKRAIAARSVVWVLVDPAAGVVRVCGDSGPACAQPLAEPGSASPIGFAAPSGASLLVQPAGLTAFGFDALGRVQGGAGQATVIAVDGASGTATVRVWNETGLAETSWTNK
jgi:MSHA pilin protein MshC